MWVLFDLLVFVAGYAAAIYSWSSIKSCLDQAAAKFSSLREKISTVTTRIKVF